MKVRATFHIEMKLKAKKSNISKVILKKKLAIVAILDEDVMILKLYMPITQLQNIHVNIARNRRN